MTRLGAVRRYNAILVTVLALVLVFAGRLVYVQAVEGPSLASAALNDRLWHSTIEAPRGDILDAHGEVLATSVRRYNLGANQRLVASYRTEVDGEEKEGAVAAATSLAPLLDEDAAELNARLVGDSTFAYIAHGLTPEQWREVRELDIPGIEPEEVSERVYPNGTTAGNIIGFVGRDGEGLAGLELSLDEQLQGVPGSSTVEVGLHGQRIPAGLNETIPARPGVTVLTSLDRDLQFRAQQVIDDYAERFGAEWASAVVQEVDTGRIVAMADSTTLDPNSFQEAEADARGVRAVQASYEPGSTGKVATFAAALDAGAVTPTTSFATPDRLTTSSGQTFSDAEPHATEELTVAGILATSSNTGTVMVGDRMPDEQRYDYFRAFGLGERPGLGLPGETAGILAPVDEWDGRQRYTTMFGQGVAVSLVQNTAVVATLANGGVRMPASLVDGTRDEEGRFQAVPEREPVRAVSEESAGQMMRMMEGVVAEEGTGVLAQVDGYRLAGKTGTAQVPDANGRLTQTVASFVGAVPAEDPQYAVGIVLYHPSDQRSSGIVAAPAFKEIAEFLVQHEGIAPASSRPELYPLRAQ